MKQALRSAVALAKPFEGLSLVPYLCPAGVPTQGYGTVYKPDGSKVSLSDPAISEATAELWLVQTLEAICISVAKASPSIVTNQQAWGAITDFVYNLGIGRYRSSTLKRRIDEQDYHAAGDELLRWVRAGGRVLPGLVKRRQAERELMLG